MSPVTIWPLALEQMGLPWKSQKPCTWQSFRIAPLTDNVFTCSPVSGDKEITQLHWHFWWILKIVVMVVYSGVAVCGEVGILLYAIFFKQPSIQHRINALFWEVGIRNADWRISGYTPYTCVNPGLHHWLFVLLCHRELPCCLGHSVWEIQEVEPDVYQHQWQECSHTFFAVALKGRYSPLQSINKIDIDRTPCSGINHMKANTDKKRYWLIDAKWFWFLYIWQTCQIHIMSMRETLWYKDHRIDQ